MQWESVGFNVVSTNVGKLVACEKKVGSEKRFRVKRFA